jgi:putative membrane protein
MAGIPFCGAPPLPGSAAWTLDPLLLAVLATGGLWLARLAPSVGAGRAAAGAAGWIVLSASLVSPLCNLAVALFGARVAQHLLLVLVAAPLLALALTRREVPRPIAPLPASACFAATLWLWHLPVPYAATFHPDGIAWWWMHGTLVAAAIWLWASIFASLHSRPEAAALAGLLTGLQMGALGALLTFAPRPLYAPHGPAVTLPWGLTPLEDQQLGGLLMWVPGGLLFAAVMVGALAWTLLGQVRHVATALLLGALLLPATAFAQGNDSTTAGAARGGDARSAAPVGVLTTSAVTTRSSGPPEASVEAPEGADRRTRVLGPVCRALSGAPLDECRAKSGM